MKPVERIDSNIEQAKQENPQKLRAQAVEELTQPQVDELRRTETQAVRGELEGKDTNAKIDQLYGFDKLKPAEAEQERNRKINHEAWSSKCSQPEAAANLVEAGINDAAVGRVNKVLASNDVERVGKLCRVDASTAEKMIAQRTGEILKESLAKTANGLERIDQAVAQAQEKMKALQRAPELAAGK